MKNNKFIWFANDADGLSMIDFLTIVITIIFFIFKILHIVLIINITDINRIDFIATAIETIDNMMIMVLASYFIKKGVDTTVSKLCLTKENKYKELYDDMRKDSTENVDDSYNSNTVEYDYEYVDKNNNSVG